MNVLPHDFTKPTRLGVDWHNRLSSWFRVALGLANKAWAKQLPAPLEVSLRGLETTYARPALSKVTDDTLAYRIKLGDRVMSFVTMPRCLMLNLVGLMLGDNTPATDRELTLIEDKLGDFFLLNHWLNFFRDSWPGSTSVPWVLDGREPNFGCTRLLADTDTLLEMSWQMTGVWGDTQGMWYFPKNLIDLLGNVNASDGMTEVQVAIRREAIVHSLAVTMEVVLGSAEISLSDLTSLQVGDVVMLDQGTSDAAIARAGGQELFRGHAGRQGSWRAFQIESTVTK
jgi:flagellar motor switch protein FliM